MVRRRGLTLIEVLSMISILAIVSALIVVALIDNPRPDEGNSQIVGVVVDGAEEVKDDEMWVEFTVVKAEQAPWNFREKNYIVFTEEGEPFTVADNYNKLIYGCDETYGKIRAGKRYRARVEGVRNNKNRTYRNILDIKEAKEPMPAEIDPES